MNKKSAIPSNEAFWINDPPEQRQAVANAYAAVPLLSLSLPVRPYNVVRRNKRYPDVGALMMAGSDIWDLRGMGLESMRRIHASLAPLFANKDGISVRGSDSATAHAIPKQWLELVHRLQSREDLAGLSLDRLGLNQTSWPWLPQPIPPTLGQLGVESARRWWIASENRAAHREQLVTWAQSLAQIPTPVDEDELVRHWLRCGIQVVPIGSIGPDQSLEPLLVGLLQEHLVTHRNELDWEILRHRSGLSDATEMTLQDLGQALGLTRERIRQRETKVHRSVQTWWSNFDHFYRPKFLHPALQDAVAGLRELIRQVRAAPLDEGALARKSQQLLRNSGPALSPLVRLLAEVEGLKGFDLDSNELGVLWVAEGWQGLARQMAGIHALHKQVTSSASSFSTVELARGIQRVQAFEPPVRVEDIRTWAPLCASVEVLPDGRYQGRLAHLASRPLQARRVLEEAGQPLHMSDLVRSLNHQLILADKKTVARMNMSNQLTGDSQLVPIGRSGYWALASWPDVELGTVLDLMERCLLEHNNPMTPEDIYAWISQRRPVSENSIVVYLTSDDRFGRADRERWGLADWKEIRDAQSWNRAGVADFVARLFGERHSKRLPFKVVRDALAEAADVPERVASGLLATNPVIDTVKGIDGELVAELQANYRVQTKEESRSSRPPGRVLEAVLRESRRVLSQQPDLQMPLGELRDILTKALRIPSTTVYSYVSRLPQLETSPSSDGQGKLVRLIVDADSDVA